MGAIPARERLEGALNTVFVLRPLEGGDASLDVRLVEVTMRPMQGGFERFSLLFVGPAALVATQGTYRVSHAVLGEFELFVVPIAPGADGPLYEAAISRVPPA